MCPWKYPAMIMDIPNRKHATSDSTSGTVGLATCVLVAFVLGVVSCDVLLGVFNVAEPTSFVFCDVMEKDRKCLNVREILQLTRVHYFDLRRFLRSSLGCTRRTFRRSLCTLCLRFRC